MVKALGTRDGNSQAAAAADFQDGIILMTMSTHLLSMGLLILGTGIHNVEWGASVKQARL
jgi:hypothetical protein